MSQWLCLYMGSCSEMIKQTELKYTANTLADLSRYLWGDNSTEFLAGALQSVITEKQMKALIDHLSESVSA
jgi:hypothetical protein